MARVARNQSIGRDISISGLIAMCTFCFVPRRNGYILGMNRDEKLARVTALRPARHRISGRDILFPAEPTGGTWIGVNDAGVTFALINSYSVPACVHGKSVSRGVIVRSALPASSPVTAEQAFATVPLLQVNSSRLVGIFPDGQKVVECDGCLLDPNGVYRSKQCNGEINVPAWSQSPTEAMRGERPESVNPKGDDYIASEHGQGRLQGN
jgi:hypothetical protein